MITLALALTLSCAIAQPPVASDNAGTALDVKLSAGQVISKMLARYASANTVSGESVWTQRAQGVSLSIRTKFQLQRPSRLYIYQEGNKGYMAGKTKNQWLVTSDGQFFSYPSPRAFDQNQPRLVERVIVNESILTCGELLVAVRKGLGDPTNPFVEMACASKVGLKVLSLGWGSIYDKGLLEYKGKTVRAIEGDFKPSIGMAPNGTYTMLVDADFGLLGYETREKMTISPEAGQAPTTLDIVTSWVGQTQVDQPIDQILFKLAK